MNEYILMTYYIKYLKNIRKVSDSTVKHYQEALRYISKYLIQKEKLSQNIYEIQDIGELEIVKTFLYNDLDFIDLDKRGHQMYSAGFNNYYRFASGQGFTNIRQQIGVMDMEVPAAQKKTSKMETWTRSTIIKIQSIEAAGYQCEVNPEHHTFTAKSSGQPYMEGHHALPIRLQEKFDTSLDVYANIVCLCPICHRLLHYGVDSEKTSVVDRIYYDRADRLASSGIKISRLDFGRLVI